MFQTSRTTGHHLGLPARLDRGRRWPLTLACVAVPAPTVREGSRPERMPKADATELAPKKSAIETLRHIPIRAGGFLVSSGPSEVFLQPISLVKLPSGGLGL